MSKDCTIQDVFHRFYPSFESTHSISPAQRKAAYHIMNCKTGAFGVNVSVCEDCGCMSVHYNSCRDRCCPMCQEFPKEKWVDARRELKTLQQQGIMIAVASNKYQAATRKLIAHYFPEINFVEVLGQREGIPAKPDPSIINEIMTKAGVKQEDILYVGDSNVDMQTAHHAGVTAIGVAWGFRPRTELEALHPAHIIEKAEELLPLLLS